MTLIVDASVATKWFVEESDSDRARRLRGEEPMMAPDFLLIEAFHVVWKRVRRGLDGPQALRDLTGALTSSFDSFAPSGDLVAAAAGHALSLSHPIYDCLYIALADREGAVLVTADERQFAAARKARVKVRML
jgi:predicted nucleic acid-binding protein